jgi:hypothetical protein
MTNQFKLLMYSILSFVLFITLIGCNADQTAKISPQTDIETFEYIVTSIDSEGLHGQSVNDSTGIFLTHDTINQNKLSLKENDKISVSFPADDWETITKIVKIN